MESKVAIIIDVDLTFVDSGTPWLHWMEQVYKVPPNAEMIQKDLDEKGHLDYNLSVYFPSPLKSQIPPYEFWEDPHLYDKMEPMPGAVLAIRRLWSAGHPIRLVSFCKKGHFSSKVRFLKHYLPFLDLDKGTDGSGFYATKVKSGVSGGVIIDDRHNFLNQFPDDVIKVKFDTLYSQEEEPRVQYDLVSRNWAEIANFLLETL